MAGKTQNAKTVSTSKIKKEAPDYEFKDYAENAMKEMLGWYGYDRGGGSGSDSSSDAEGQQTNENRTISPRPAINVKEINGHRVKIRWITAGPSKVDGFVLHSSTGKT